ncbi:MAG: beta-propeller fold lactonase family protein [bacterium]
MRPGGIAALVALQLILPVAAHAAPYAYVAARGSGVVVVIDMGSNTLVAAIEVGPGPMATAVHPDGSKVFVTTGPQDKVVVIDTATNRITGTVAVGDNPTGIDVSPDGRKIYVVNTSERSLSVIDPGINKLLSTVPLQNHPFWVAVHPNSSKVYVAGDHPGHVSVIDGATNAVTETIPIGESLGGMAMHPGGGFLYVADSGNDTLAVINTTTRQVIKRVPVGRIPIGVAVHPTGSTVYVTNLLSEGFVSVIETTNYSLTHTVMQPGLSMPQGAGLHPNGNVLYVANRGTNDVITIDTTTNRLFGPRISVGGAPTGFGRFVGPDIVSTKSRMPLANAPAHLSATETELWPGVQPPRAAGEFGVVSVPFEIELMPNAAITAFADIVYSLDDCVWVKDLNTSTATPITGRPSLADPSLPVCDNPTLKPAKHAAVNYTRTRMALVVGEDTSGAVETKLILIDLPSRKGFLLMPDFARAAVGGIDFAPNGDLYFAGVPFGDPTDPKAAEASEIFRIPPDLSTCERVTDIRNRGLADVSVSEDGKKIAFNALVLSTGNLEILEVNIDGSNPRIVIQGGAIWQDSVHDPEHSSDSSEVVYSRIRLHNPDGSACGPNWGEMCHDLYRQRVDGGPPTRVSFIGNTSVVPDWKGTNIVYHFRRGAGAGPDSWIGSFLTDQDGKTIVPIGGNFLFAKWIP